MVEGEGGWSVERRFRVTEVFLALLWVSLISPLPLGRSVMRRRKKTLEIQEESCIGGCGCAVALRGTACWKDGRLTWDYSAVHQRIYLSFSRTASCRAGTLSPPHPTRLPPCLQFVPS